MDLSPRTRAFFQKIFAAVGDVARWRNARYGPRRGVFAQPQAFVPCHSLQSVVRCAPMSVFRCLGPILPSAQPASPATVAIVPARTPSSVAPPCTPVFGAVHFALAKARAGGRLSPYPAGGVARDAHISAMQYKASRLQSPAIAEVRR